MARTTTDTRTAELRWNAGYFLGVALALAGCGDDGGGTGTDAGGMMGSPDAGTMPIMDSGAGEVDAGPDDMDAGTADPLRDCSLDHLLVLTTDYVSGGIGKLDLGTDEASVAGVATADQDQAAVGGCMPAVLERGLGRLALQDPSDVLTTAGRIDVNPDGVTDPYMANPQAFVLASPTKGYVVQGARNEVVVVDPSVTGEAAVLHRIDLSSFVQAGDMDGLVDATSAIVVDGRLYVALGNYWFDMDWAGHFEPAELVVIDTATDTFVDMDEEAEGIQGIALANRNPWRGLHHDVEGNALWVAATGDSFQQDGALDVVDLATGQVTASPITEEALGGEIEAFAFVSSTRLLVLLEGNVVAVDPTAETPTPTTVVEGVGGMLLHGGDLFVWSRDGESAGLRRFDARTGSETTPSVGPWTFGDLPIASVAPAP